jgi:hypothetical protein
MARVKPDALRVPLQGKKVRATGEILLRAEVLLLVSDADESWHLLPFRADSASEMTTLPAAAARKLNIPMPLAPTTGLRVDTPSATQDAVRAGAIKARFFGMEEDDYWFPCYFLGDPEAEGPQRPGTIPRSLLGLTGVVDKVTLVFDGDATEDAPYGHLVIEIR